MCFISKTTKPSLRGWLVQSDRCRRQSWKATDEKELKCPNVSKWRHLGQLQIPKFKKQTRMGFLFLPGQHKPEGRHTLAWFKYKFHSPRQFFLQTFNEWAAHLWQSRFWGFYFQNFYCRKLEGILNFLTVRALKHDSIYINCLESPSYLVPNPTLRVPSGDPSPWVASV